MTWNVGVLAVASAAIVAFVAVFGASGLVTRARAAIAVALQTLAAIGDASLDDEEKERRVQRAALDLFGHFAMITLIGMATLAIPLAVIWAGDLVGLAPFDAVSNFLLSWEVVLGASVLAVAALWWARAR